MQKKCTTETKLREVMRMGAVQGMIAMILCGISAAHDNYSQLLEQRVTLSLHNVPLEKVLKEIEATTSVKFMYSADQLDVTQMVSIESSGEALQVLLDRLLVPLDIKYKAHLREASITLRPQQTKADAVAGKVYHEPGRAPLLLTVTGKVNDATTRQPMAGVNVIIKGTTTGTTTDAEGSYSISAEEGQVLVFSFIGYTTYEIDLDGRTVVDVGMSEDIRGLEEVVINAGYWSLKEREKTSSIGRITALEIEKQPVSNSVAALQARIPGMEITQSTGVPGGNFRVRIRGSNSISSGNDPLYIIDGVPFISSSTTFAETSGEILGNPNPAAAQGSSPLNTINPADIESIEVLKDAAATAIYGSRGSNGVVLITTKKGKGGATKIHFSMYSGIARVARKVELLNTEQYIQMRKESLANDLLTPSIANARDLVVWDTARSTNWQKELIGGAARITDAQLNVSGGDNRTQFTFGAGYHRETTVFPGDNSDQRISTRIALTNTSQDNKLKTSVSVNYSVNQTDLPRRDLTSSAVTLPPIAPPLYGEDGEISWTNWSSSYENPLAHLQRRYEALTNTLILNAVPTYSVLPNLDVRANLGYTATGSDATTMIPRSSMDPAIAAVSQNQTNFSSNNFSNWIAEPQVSWRPKFKNSGLNLLIGGTFLQQLNKGLAQSAFGFASEAMMKNLASAPTRSVGANYYSKYRYAAAFARLNYILMGRYILDLTGRRDGSSRFGPGRQFANFGAIGAAWIFSEETFVRNTISFLSFGKLRMSYGLSGNDQLGDYQYLDSYRSSPAPYQTTIGLTPARLSNPDFAWETNKKFEAAIELGGWNDRLVGSASFYRNRSSNQLVGYPLPPTAGFTNVQGNFPAVVQNKGLEVELRTRNVDRTAFSWSTALNFTVPRNELLEFPNLESSPSYANTYEVGEPLNIRKFYHYLEVDPTTGLYVFEDVNQDNTFDIRDRTAINFVGQKFYGGFLNTFVYRGLQVEFFFQFVKQIGLNPMQVYPMPGIISNELAGVMDRWTSIGDSAPIQKFSSTNNPFASFSRFTTSDRMITDASFIRLKNASVSYTIPHSIASKWHSSATRVFLLVQNLVTFTRYPGLDPEHQLNLLPPLRVLTGGLSITF